VWLRATEVEEADQVQEADRLAIVADFEAITGEKWPSTRREFSRLWLSAIKAHGKAINEKGEAVTMASRAGYLWAVPFVPTLSAVWSDIVGRWASKKKPWAVVSGRYYQRGPKGEAVQAVKTEATKAIAQAEALAKAVAEAKAKAGEEARKTWAAEKAQADLNDELERTSKQLAAIDRETDFNVAIAEAAGKSWEEIHKLRLEAARTKLALADMSYDALVASGKATKDQLKQAAEESRKAWENVLKVLDEGVIHEIQMRNKKPTKPKGGGGATTQKAQTYDAGELGGITITGNIMRSIDRAFEQAGTSSEGLSNYISALKQQIAKEDIGSDLYNSLTSKLTDASTMQTVIASALKAGVSGADLSDIAKEMKAKMLDGDIDDATVASLEAIEGVFGVRVIK
jgi:hypothetical protein